MSDIFFVQLGRRGNLFANLSRVVMVGSRGLGKRLERRDEGSWTDLRSAKPWISGEELSWNYWISWSTIRSRFIYHDTV